MMAVTGLPQKDLNSPRKVVLVCKAAEQWEKAQKEPRRDAGD